MNYGSATGSDGHRFLSFVIPLHNEKNTLQELASSVASVCLLNGYAYEIVFVDDGSDDGSFAVIEGLASQNPCIRAIQFRRNFGQAAAMNAGIEASCAPVIIALDADLQNDPADTPALLAKLDEGYDVVSGWRRDRKDNWLRRWPSYLANALISRITGVRLSDYGCTLKAYRSEFLEDVVLYGEMHRFIPVFAAWQGARVAEIPVHHAPRKYGRSHYGIRRTGKVILDLLTVKFLHTYISRPMHFFGAIGFLLMLGGLLAGLVAIYLKLADIRAFVDTPLPLLSALLLIVGIQFMLMGLIAELLIRVYFSHRDRQSYAIRRSIGNHTTVVVPS